MQQNITNPLSLTLKLGDLWECRYSFCMWLDKKYSLRSKLPESLKTCKCDQNHLKCTHKAHSAIIIPLTMYEKFKPCQKVHPYRWKEKSLQCFTYSNITFITAPYIICHVSGDSDSLLPSKYLTSSHLTPKFLHYQAPKLVGIEGSWHFSITLMGSVKVWRKIN